MQKIIYQSLIYLKRVRWKNLFLSFTILVGLTLNMFLPAGSTSAAACDDVEFIFARGSGEDDEGWSYSVWKRELEQVMQDANLKYSFYDLGAKSYNGHRYPAVPVTESFGGVVNLIGAAISSGEAFAFGDSVNEGVEELKLHIQDISRHCRNTKFVLGGFSQGAMVISKSLDQLDSDKIIYAATFGDPKLYLPEGNNRNGIFYKVPDACRGINLSNYRVYVPDCYSYEGALGSYRPYQPDGYWDKLGTWCNGKDIMCSSGMSISDHTDYVNGDLYARAARVIRERIRATFADKVPVSDQESPNLHDVVFLFDVTGSMKPLINTYKTEAKKLIQKVLMEGGRTALFLYRDYVKNTWPYLDCDFGTPYEKIMSEIENVNVWGGADRQEGLLSAINAAFEQINWRPGATKSIVALTDADFHNPDDDGSTIDSIVQRSLEIDPVNVYVIAPEELRETYAELTSRTNGAFFDIKSELEYSTDRIFERPAAFLDLENYYGLVGETITFDASASYGFAKDPLIYDWDLDGDGNFELKNQSSIIKYTYKQPFNDFIQVRVSDSSGSSTMSAKVQISAQPSRPVEIKKVAVESLSHNSAKVNFTTDAKQVLVVLEDEPFGLIQAEGSQGEFIINELEQSTKVTLVPYSAEPRRGIKTEVMVAPDEEFISIPSDTNQTKPSDTTPILDHTQSSSSVSNSQPAPPTPAISVPGMQHPITNVIPSVPNTGCCDRKFI